MSQQYCLVLASLNPIWLASPYKCHLDAVRFEVMSLRK